MNCKLSLKQEQILNLIKSEIISKGYPPSVREMCDAVGLKSTSTVHSHLKKLEYLGLIKKDPTKPRAITVVDVDSINKLNFDDYITNKSNLRLLPKVSKSEISETFTSLLFDSPNIEIFKSLGNGMINSKIFDGDYVIVDSSMRDFEGQIVLAVVNNEYSTIRRLSTSNNMIRLDADNSSGECIFINRNNVKIIGTVIGSFRNFY